jgi:hypothetical protein
MLPDALPQLLDTLLRLPHLEAAQVKELIEQLSDPQASAQEMVRRGWITQDQFSSLFPGPQQRETMLLGIGDNESPPDADCDDWSLPLSDEQDQADVAPEVERPQPERTDKEMLPERETVKALPVLVGAASTPQFDQDILAPAEARQRQKSTDKLLAQWLDWASTGLLASTLILGSFFAGVRWANFRFPYVAQESREANVGDPARAIDLPPAAPIVPINNAKQR